jgi:hypothetical protein
MLFTARFRILHELLKLCYCEILMFVAVITAPVELSFYLHSLFLKDSSK